MALIFARLQDVTNAKWLKGRKSAVPRSEMEIRAKSERRDVTV